MSTKQWELLSVFVDGEEVDPDELAAVLALPGASDALIEFVRLRARLSRDKNELDAGIQSAIRQSIQGRPQARSRLAAWSRVAAAIAVLIAALSVPGLRKLQRSEPPPIKPPEPTIVLHFESGVDWYSAGSKSTGVHK